MYNQYENIVAYHDRINNGVAMLNASHVDGIIYVGMHDRHLDFLFDPLPLPFVFAYSHGMNQDTYVTYSNEESAASLTRCLIVREYKRIAVITGHPHSCPTMRRLIGFQLAMQEAGLVVATDYIRYGNWEYESGIEKMKELMTLDPLPSAMFAMNDLMTDGCVHAFNNAGLRVPQVWRWQASTTAKSPAIYSRRLPPPPCPRSKQASGQPSS